MPAKPLTLTAGQTVRAQAAFHSLRQARAWSGQLPVLVLNRCWLRLTVVSVERLALELPPDLSRAAPELERYRALIEAGHSAWQAQQLCWLEFGAEACQQALRHFWRAQDRPTHGWTLERYLSFLADYRQAFSPQQPRHLPLIVLARPSGQGDRPSMVEDHGILWLRPDLTIVERAMRHTCA
ncbi:MAG: hypothetical protein VKO39_12475 [Cyanobacteriota bacterium]|nr:hypothetical protein [Cyanobacteriota bacterium]